MRVVSVEKDVRLCERDFSPPDPCRSLYMLAQGSLGIISADSPNGDEAAVYQDGTFGVRASSRIIRAHQGSSCVTCESLGFVITWVRQSLNWESSEWSSDIIRAPPGPRRRFHQWSSEVILGVILTIILIIGT